MLVSQRFRGRSRRTPLKRGRSALIFHELELAGAWIVELEPLADERGSFARAFCAEEFARRGLDARVAQSSVSWNARAGTLRGLHWQAAPWAESKLVRCARGALWDVIVDLRTASPTYRRWIGVELSPKNRRQLFIPAGFAQGFQTLVDDTEVHYQMSVPYHPEAMRGARWDDATLAIGWPPARERIISARDRALPLLADAEA